MSGAVRVLSYPGSFESSYQSQGLDLDIRAARCATGYEEWKDDVSSIQVALLDVDSCNGDDEVDTTFSVSIHVELVCYRYATLARKHACAGVDHGCLVEGEGLCVIRQLAGAAMW